MSGVPGGRPEGLSICIPNWHHKPYFGRCLGSALDAARRLVAAGWPAQVLVLDDASRDGSPRQLFSLAMMDADGLLDVHPAAANGGLAVNRNRALALARYRWVCFLDADNALEPGTLVHFVRAIRNTGATLVYGNLIVESGGAVATLASNDVVGPRLLEKNYIDAFCLVDAPRVLALGGYSSHPHARSVEDWELVLHLVAEEQSLVFVPLVLGRYHVEPDSMITEGRYNESGLRRMYDQRRSGLPAACPVGRIYHPDLGYLDD